MPRRDESAVEPIDLDGIRDYLARTEVIFAVLFGSRASGTADESSDVDLALRFPDELSDAERFRQRNRIDADVQSYADAFVDVSDIESLPTHVAHRVLRDGVRLVGDQADVETYRQDVEAEYAARASERDEERRAFIDRLARGDV